MSESERTIVLVDPSSAKDYTCGICKELFQNPKETPCCRHALCYTCIVRALSSTPSCPLCRRQISANGLLELNKNYKSQWESLRVYCINRPECAWIGSKSNLEAHLASDCEFELRSCPNSFIQDLPACSERFFNSTLQSHIEKCPFEKLKPFLGCLTDHVAEIANKSTKMESTVDTLKEKQEKQEKCNRVVSLITKTHGSFTLPLSPPIAGNHYITMIQDNEYVRTSTIVPGCIYVNSELHRIPVASYDENVKRWGRVEADRFKSSSLSHAEVCMNTMNILAKMGYSISLGMTTLGVGMEYTGIKWTTLGVGMEYTGIKWISPTLPPYVLVRKSDEKIMMFPELPGYSLKAFCAVEFTTGIALVNSLVEKYPYRLLRCNQELSNYLLQILPAP